MKAAVFREAGLKLVVEEVPIPTPGPGQLLLQVRHCGICGSDLHATSPSAARNPRPGSVLGHEFCGEIVALGAGAGARWQEGDRVTALPFIGCGECANCRAGQPVWCAKVRSHAGGRIPGAFAEYVVVGERETVRLPASLSWRESALVEPIAVGLHGVNLANLAPGSDILVVGAGPIGLAVIACARALGAGRIVATAKSSRRAELALSMGASDFIEMGDDSPDAFQKLVGGPPAAVFECVGVPGMIDYCARMAAPRSTVVMLGVCMEPDEVRPMTPLTKELRLQFSMAYGLEDFQVAADLIAMGRVNAAPMITDVVGFEAFPEAFEALRDRTSQCKVLLQPRD